MDDHHFANLLLSGPCNLRCPACIGRRAGAPRFASTLDSFPLPGLDAFSRLLVAHHCREISLTGIDTEPQLYRHQEQLIDWLRSRIARVRLSLHTNGTRILSNPRVFNRYDRATLSLPSLDAATCATMTGSPRVLDLRRIVEVARIPLKISVLVTRDNVAQLPDLIAHCRGLGIRRMVLRKPFGENGPAPPSGSWRLRGHFGRNPVFDAGGLEITVWDFEHTRLHCLSLLPDGTVCTDYRLVDEQPRPARPLRPATPPDGEAMPWA